MGGQVLESRAPWCQYTNPRDPHVEITGMIVEPERKYNLIDPYTRTTSNEDTTGIHKIEGCSEHFTFVLNKKD